MTVNITLAPDRALGTDEYDEHAPVTYPSNAIEQAVNDTITNTPTPCTVPGTPLHRLERIERKPSKRAERED